MMIKEILAQIIKGEKVFAKKYYLNDGKINYPGEDFSCVQKGTDGKNYILNFKSGILVQVVEETDG